MTKSAKELRPSLNLITLLRADIKSGIAAAAEAGFEFVELWVDPLETYLKNNSIEDLRKLLDESRMRVSSIGDIESITFCTPAQAAELRGRCAHLAAVARALNCPYLVVSGSVKPRGTGSDALAEEIRLSLGAVLDVVEPEGVGVALAFRGFSWCSINTLAGAIKAVEYHKARRAGLVLDTFDLHIVGAEPGIITSLDPAKIFVMRLSDCGDVPLPLITDTARLLPGEGKADLEAMLSAVASSGFSGAVSLKVLSPRLLDMSAIEVAGAAMAAAEKYVSNGSLR
ncbi:MAG: sugar phosphate isomerase/epimerase [Candidatus Abyssobacteria bacterium SURF_5]|uniref:Sugar phosphate isomerase/epimerase n=1 Tax=Abyssobacteria bacterium (strain SURF_5) TaxID=2093360 RepID=A0A3A4P0D0_ABYX5|nr:MAG: sugar phosphate isomerase/epimerase [Candidatus Abyssubacteria bacterium SURF_5]